MASLSFGCGLVFLASAGGARKVANVKELQALKALPLCTFCNSCTHLTCASHCASLERSIMAMIHVNRGATSLGVFSEEEVREGLATGRFAPTDLGWREGMASWQPLSQFPEFAGAPGPAMPPVQAGAVPATGPAGAARSGLPWEHRQERGFFNAFVERHWQWFLPSPVRHSRL